MKYLISVCSIEKKRCRERVGSDALANKCEMQVVSLSDVLACKINLHLKVFNWAHLRVGESIAT